MNQATLGTELHDISKLIAGQQKVSGALSSREGSLKDLISNLNITTSALAAQQSDLRRRCASCPRCSRRPARRWTA